MADDLSSALDQIRERSDRPLGPSVTALPISNEAVRGLLASAADVPRLLAALRAVLELADEWGAEARQAADRSDAANERGEDGTFHLNSGRMLALDECTDALREAITREITRKVESDERESG